MHLVRAALDPVLVPAGFLAGQGDDEQHAGQVIWCIGHDALTNRYPLLPQADMDDVPGRCDDLVVDIGADGTVDRLDLEGTSLADTLRQVGLDAHAEAMSHVRDRPVADSLRVLEAALRELFGAPS